MLVRMVGGPLHNAYKRFGGDVLPVEWIHRAADPQLAACDFLPGEIDYIIISPRAYVEVIYYLRAMRTEYGTRYWEYHWEGWEEPTHVDWGHFDANL